MIRRIRIGLVNNMPDSALDATERQFRNLLTEAAEDHLAVELSLFEIPEIPRSHQARSLLARSYSSIGELWEHPLDALIVTGAEPQAANLTAEPYWNSLAQVIDWSRENTHSSIFSCLAAHAAVLRFDDIPRLPLTDKLCGVFECASLLEHPLTAGLPARFPMPHSRWNNLPEQALSERGYAILSRAENAGVDAFIKPGRSLSVFFQGHPEYEADTLLFEYRRDVRRFLTGGSGPQPAVPQGYFEPDGVTVSNTWHRAAVRFYRNWLRYLAAQRKPAVAILPKASAARVGGMVLNTPARLKEGRDGPF